MLSGFPPVAGPLQLLAALGLGGMLELARLLLMPAHGARRTSCSAATARAPGCTAAAMHGDVPPLGAGSAIAAAYLNLMGHAVGWPSPEGGADRLADALVGHLRELGGVTRTGARVDARAGRARARHRRRARGRRARAGARSWSPTSCRTRLLALAGDALDGRLRRARCAATA